MNAFDTESGSWDPALDPLRAGPGELEADVAGLLPSSLRDTGPVPTSIDAGLGEITETARLLPALARLGERGEGALARSQLDAVARFLGVGVYGEAATDDEVREICRSADTYHRVRGTPAGMRWAVETLAGQPGSDDEGVAAVEVVEQGSSRAAELGGRLPALSHWAELWVVVHADLADEGRWDASVGRALRHALPAGVIPTWVLLIPDAQLAGAEGADPAFAAEALASYAEDALGPGYRIWTTPTMNGEAVMDGTFSMSPDAVVARRDREFLPSSTSAPPVLLTASAVASPGALDGAAGFGDGGVEAVELVGRDGGGFRVRSYSVSYRGQPYRRESAEVVPYRLFRDVVVDREPAGPGRSGSVTLTVSDLPPGSAPQPRP